MYLDSAVLQKMGPSEQAEFQMWESFLESDSYKLLCEFLGNQAESVHYVIQNPNSWDEHVYARGQRDALNLVLNLEAILEARVQEMVAEADEDEMDQHVSIEL